MAIQSSGWGSTSNAADLPVVDAFSRNLLMRYGGRTDDIWSYHDMPGYKQEMGSASSAPRMSSPSGGYRYSSFDGGGTSSDPGKHNWATLGNVTQFAQNEIINPLLDIVSPQVSRSGRSAPRMGKGKSIYGKFRGKQIEAENTRIGNAVNQARQQKAQQIQQAQQQAQQAQQQQQQFSTFASQTMATAQSLAAGQQAKGKKVTKGASSKLRPGQPSQVNLLTGPTALGQPAKKPRAARSTIATPKTTRPAPINTFDPSIW
jgi:hypothetical protein